LAGHADDEEVGMSRMSFKQFISRRGKKDSRDGKGGLPSFSNTHPYFSGRLRIPHGGPGGHGEGSYENPWQNAGPQYGDGGPFGNDPDWDRKEREDWEEYYQWLDDVSGQDWPDPPDPPDPIDVQSIFVGEPDPPEIPGPKSLDLLGCDLSGKIKYPKDSPCWQAMHRNMNTPKSNRYSLYYTGE